MENRPLCAQARDDSNGKRTSFHPDSGTRGELILRDESGLSADEKLAYEQLVLEYAKGIGYGYQMGLRPQALHGIADSPVGIAGYFLDHDARSLAMISRVFDGQPEGLTRDDVLDNVTLTLADEQRDFRGASLLGGIRE